MEQYQTFKISEFIHKVSFEKILLHIIEQLKKHLLDSIASLLYAVNKPTIQKLVRQIDKLGEGGYAQPCFR